MTMNKYEFNEFTHEGTSLDEKQAFLLCWLMQNFDAFRESDITFGEAAEMFESAWADPLYGVLH